MPVRIVTSGGDPVRIVTSGISDPVRVVTSGLSTPVVIVGGSITPDAPTFVSAEVGNVDASTVVVTFSTDISAPCGDCALGFTVLVNGAPDAVTACVIVGGNTVQLTLTTAVAFGDVVTISYDSTVGCIMESTGVTDLATFGAQAVTNNVAAIPWYLSGGIAAANCLAAYTPKGAASLAASYDNNAAPGNGLPDGTYDCTLGVAPTLEAVGWNFDGTQYLKTGLVPASGYSMLVQFSNVGVDAYYYFIGENELGVRFQVYPKNSGNRYYDSGGSLGIAGTIASGNMGIAGQQGYLNGVADGGAIPGWGGPTTRDIWIGSSNSQVTHMAIWKVQAVSIYATTITAPQMLAVATAMALI